MPRQRLYCAVNGCMNSTIIKPEIAFFRFPADAERRSKWLHLICREELANKSPHSYTVCEEHFDDVDILAGPQRTKLKKNSLPSLNLPNLEKNNVQKITEVPVSNEKCTQTEEEIILTNDSTQTDEFLSSDTPRKRKLKSDRLNSKNKKFLENGDISTLQLPISNEESSK